MNAIYECGGVDFVSLFREGDGSGSGQSSEETRREENEQTESDSSNIHIKLKYLNDDLKVVEGSLQENLGDFKR